MMNRAAILMLTCLFVGCATQQPQSEALPELHPKVFSMVECWLSDTQEPVVTEINVDAVLQNDSQFNGEMLSDGPWIRVDSENGRGFMRYRVLRRQGSSWFVEFQNNGGGTLTTSTTIEFTLEHRTFTVDRDSKQVQVMRVESMRRTTE